MAPSIFGMDIPDSSPSSHPSADSVARSSEPIRHNMIAVRVAAATPVIAAVVEKGWATVDGIGEVIGAACSLAGARTRSMVASTTSNGVVSVPASLFLPVATKMVVNLVRQAQTPAQLQTWIQKIDMQERNGLPVRVTALGKIVGKCAEKHRALGNGHENGAAELALFVAEMLGPDIIPSESAIPVVTPAIERLIDEVVNFSARQAGSMCADGDPGPVIIHVFNMCGRLMLPLAKKFLQGGTFDDAAVDAVVTEFHPLAQMACDVVARRVAAASALPPAATPRSPAGRQPPQPSMGASPSSLSVPPVGGRGEAVSGGHTPEANGVRWGNRNISF